MAEVYKFNVKLVNLEEIIWRDIEITSVSSAGGVFNTFLYTFIGISSVKSSPAVPNGITCSIIEFGEPK